jgi:hypothetical protein
MQCIWISQSISQKGFSHLYHPLWGVGVKLSSHCRWIAISGLLADFNIVFFFAEIVWDTSAVCCIRTPVWGKKRISAWREISSCCTGVMLNFVWREWSEIIGRTITLMVQFFLKVDLNPHIHQRLSIRGMFFLSSFIIDLDLISQKMQGSA